MLNLLSDCFLSLGNSVSLEAGTARARQKNLRGAEAPSILIYVKREGTWKKITSDILMPGDYPGPGQDENLPPVTVRNQKTY